MSTRSIAIIGGGFSGTVLAARLLREAEAPLHVYLIERRSLVGQGVAYSTSNPRHLLNVPAGRMSAFPELPTHFIDWLQAHEPSSSYTETSFVPRRVFGEYLASCLDSARLGKRDGVEFEVVRGEAEKVTRSDGMADIQLDSGSIQAHHVVLAIGNFPPGHVHAEGLTALPDGIYRADPWSDLNLSEMGEDSHVLLLGTGLTAIDLALTINEHRPDAVIHMASPTGEVPAEWRPSTDVWPVDLGGVAPTTLAVTRAIRAHIREAQSAGHRWEEVFDSIRGQTPALWRGLSSDERQRFMRRVRSFFERYRHRIPPATAAILRDMQGDGRLRLYKGIVQSVEPSPEEGAEVTLQVGDGKRVLRVKRIVNCTGPACDYRRMKHPLIRSLLDAGMVQADAMRLGIACGENGALLNSDGNTEGWLWSLGPPLKGALWETTAVPEIRVQAKQLAAVLGGNATPS